MISITEQKLFYDKFWADARPANALEMARCGTILTELSRLELTTPRILDLGCGSGWLTAILAHFGETVGADLSPEAASQRFPIIQFLAVDFSVWHPTLAPFDVVVSQEVIEHLEDQARYVDIAADLLKPSGHLILTTPNATTTNAWPENWLKQPIENVVSARELRRLLSRRFEVMRMRTIILGYGSKGIRRVVNSVKLRAVLSRLRLVKSYDGTLEWLGFGLHLIVVARKRA